MTIENASPDISAATQGMAARPEPEPAPAPPSWPWRRTALLLAIAAQLITISAVVNRVDPVTVTWAALMLAIAPAPLAAAAAFTPAPVNKLAAVAGVAVLIAGAAGFITHTGLFFVPALVALAVGLVKMWRERS